MSISIYNYIFVGDCSNTSSGSVSFDITGTTGPFAVNCLNTSCPLPSSATTYSYSASSLSAIHIF